MPLDRPTETPLKSPQMGARPKHLAHRVAVFGYYLQEDGESSTQAPQLQSAESYAVPLGRFWPPCPYSAPPGNGELDTSISGIWSASRYDRT